MSPLRALPLTLFCSGAAALVYQVVWVRQLALVLGSHLDAVSVVLATFMGGLGLGGALAAKWVDRQDTDRLPKIYAALEGGIALAAILFPLALAVTRPVLAGVQGTPARLVAAMVFLMVPTTLMGATLPTLTALRERVVAGSGGVGRSAGILYAANTFGAVVGSLATGVFLIYWLGLRWTTLLAVLLNAVAAAVVLAANIEPTEVRPSRERAPATVVLAGLGAAALSGFAALGSEVAWTRAIVLLIGPTTYGFSFIVSAVIFGIAAGSALATRWTARSPARRLALVQLGAAVVSIVLVQIIGGLPIPVGELVHANAENIPRLLALELFWVTALLVPPSLLFGASFPLAVAVVGGAPADATGRTYLWNTLGAVVGSLAIGLWLLPSYGSELSLYVTASAHAAACVWLLVTATERGSSRVAAAAVSLLTVGAFFLLPRWDREMMSGGLYKVAPYLDPGEFLDFLRRGDLVFYDEDKAATVTVKTVGSHVSLAVDGKVDATNREDMLTQRMLAHVPLVLHPNPKRVLVIGFGSGVTVGSALTHAVDEVEAVEISTSVTEASSHFRGVNHDPLSDRRVSLYATDGRNHLLVADEPYDVIISEPSNPWMAGVSSLFTRDFFQLAHDRLAASGLFCQWAHIYNMSEDDLKTIVASFTDVFDDSSLFLLSESDILLVGARDALLVPTLSDLTARLGASRVSRDLDDVGVHGLYGFESLLAARTPALSEWANDAVRHTDDHPVLEFRAARAMHADTGSANREAIQALSGAKPRRTPKEIGVRAAMLEAAESFDWAFDLYEEARDFDGMVRTALAMSDPARAGVALQAYADGDDAAKAHRALGLLYRNTGQLGAAVASLQASLALDDEARDTLLLAAEVAGDRGEADVMAAIARTMLSRDPLDAEAAAILAEVSLRRDDPALAVQQASAILAKRPDEPRALQVLAIGEVSQGNREAARDAFERLTEREPDAFVHYNNYGRLELEAGNFERAMELFERAVDLNPRNLAGYEGLAQAADHAGDRARLERARSMLTFLAP